MAGRASSRLGGLDLLGLGRRRLERPLGAQVAGRLGVASLGESASHPAQFALGESAVRGLEVYRAVESYEETSAPFSAEAPGEGRRLHLAYALSEGRCEELAGVVVDGEVLSGAALTRAGEVSAADGGGVTYTATTGRGGSVKVTSYVQAAGTEGATLRAAHGRMVARAEAGRGAMPLAWDASHQGHGVSWCHVELLQPPVGVTAEGLPERLLWDDVPELGFVVKGKHLAIPSSGVASSWQRGYTDSAAAVRYWWLRERLGVPAERIDAASVRSAHTRSGQRIEVRIEDTVRYAWLATADAQDGVETSGTAQAPTAPSGNEFPPSRPADLADDAPWWSKSPVEPTDASPTVWRAESVRDIEGVWSDWGDVTRYQGLGEEPLRDVRPASDPAPAMPEAPADGSDYVVTLDRYAEGLPAGFNPGDADDPVRAALEADAASSRYGVSGAISAADDPERVEEELDFAWAGSVVELGGRLSFRPGADVASSGTITAANGEALSVAPPPPRSERINGASLSLPASRIHGGAGYSLPELMDETAVALDGAALVEDLGEAAYLSSPTAARRVLRTMLRASRAARGRRYRVQAGSSGSWLSVRPGRQVTVTDSTQGLADAGFLVVGTVLAPDTGTLELDLLEQSAGTFVDEIELPVAYSAMVRAVLAAPMDLEAQDLTWIGRDGTARSRIKVTWTQETGASTQVKWLPVLLADQTLETVVDGMPETIKMADASDSESLVSTGGSAYLAPVRQGVLYLISARHVLGGVESPWSLTFVAALGDEQTPASPSGLRGMPIPGGVRLEWSLAAEKDYAHTEVYDGSSGTVVVRETRPIGRIRGTYFEHRIESPGAMPAARSYLVRHVDRSGNASAEGSVSATPLPLRSGGELLRDEAYLAQAAGAEAPTGVDLSGEWTRKPVAPTDSLPVVWRSYREAELGGEVNLVWSQWTAPQPYAVFEDRAVDGFTRNVELEFRSSDPEGVLIAESDVFIEPTPNAPLVEVRQRFRASFADSFPDWDLLVQRWTTVGKYTHDGVRCGVLAALDRSYGCDPNEQRSIYRRTASATAPGNPGGTHAIPADWSPGKLSASAEERYVYRLTVNATNCEWPDWTVAGTPELFDEWTEAAYWTLVDGGDAPETPEGEAPEGWLDTQPEFNTAPQCRWTSTRSGSPCAGYTWSAPERDGAEEGARSIYTRTNSSAAPPNPGGTESAPADWSADELCATDAERYAYSLTVTTTHCMWPDWSTAGDPVPSDEWTDASYWTLESAGDAPATPSGETPPVDWSDMRPEFNDAPQCRWTSTRSGSPCAGYAWSTPERDGANEETRLIYRRTNSSTAPANPGGTLSAPADWSTDELCATDAERYAYSLTVTTTHCVWPDWSTAGDPVSTDEWTDTPYWTLESGGDAPATPSGETPPADWSDMRPEFDDAPQCRWKSTRSGSPCAGYAWSAPERDGANEATRSIYRRTNSSTAPANPGGTLPAPADWSADELCATAAERYVHSLTVTTANCIWPAWSTAAAEVSDEWTVTEYRRLTDTETAPAAPTVDEPADWTTERPAITDSMPYRWKSTREGSECAGYTWTAPVIDPDSRSVYKLTNSATPPANPTGAAEVPDGWSEEKLCATSDNRYVYCLTVTPVNGVWPDWSTAGTPVLFDQWTETPYYWLAAGCESPPAPSLAWPTAPPDFTTAPQCRWTSTRSGSPCAGYTWSTTEIDACNEGTRSIYRRTVSSTPPANPGGTESAPADWSADELCATDAERYAYSLTVTTTHCMWPDWSTAGDPVSTDEWTDTPYWTLESAGDAPATPSGETPPVDWSDMRPEFNDAPQCRWTSTRSGSPCAGYAWSTPERDGANEETRSIYRRTNSSTAPANPGGTLSAPADWSTDELCATDAERYAYSLTVTTTHCVWPDWSTAGDPVSTDEWTDTPYWTLESGGDAPATPSGETPPVDWTDMRPEFDDAPQCRWKSTRSGSPCAGYAWSAPERDGANEETRSIYRRTNSSTAPANPGGTLPAPADWSADELCATAAERYVHSLTVTTTHCVWPAWSTVAAEASDEWTVTDYWRLTATDTVPSTPTDEMRDGWVMPRPDATEAKPYRWKSTRKGSDCADYTWTVPVLNLIEQRYVYLLSMDEPAAPGGTAYPPQGWSETEPEPTSTQGVWRSCQTVRNNVAEAWGNPELWDGQRHAYKEAATQPATPTDTSYPPPGWLDEPPAQPTSFVWKIGQTVTDGVGGAWTAPERPATPQPPPPEVLFYRLGDGVRPRTPTGAAPAGWTTDRLALTMAPQCRWKSTRSGWDFVGYTWTKPVLDEANEASRTIYKRTNSATPPTNPGGKEAVPDGWSGEKPSATSDDRYVYSLTVTTVHCAWPDWSTAGTPVLTDHWTVRMYYWLAQGCESAPAPSLAWPTVPPDFTTAPQCRWTSTRSGSPCADYAWSTTEIDACNEGTRTIYKPTATCTPPANPGGTDSVPEGWYGSKQCASSTKPCVYSLTVTTVHCVWPDWSTAGTPELFDKWTVTPYYWLAEGCESPPAPSVTWPTAPPDFTTAPQCRWTSTRSGSPCADYAWSTTEIHACNEGTRTIYKPTATSTPPANPGGADSVPEGWYGSKQCASSTKPCVYSLTVTTVHCVWPDWSTAGTPVLFDKWTVTQYYWLAEGCESPPAPSVTWPTAPPDFTTAPQCRWTSTRSGSPCADYAWSTTEIHACNEGTRTIYKPTATSTPPANPGGADSVPEGWYGSKQCASSTNPCVYSLTVTTVHCVWPDWSTAGTPELFDKWTVTQYWLLTERDDTPATPTGAAPPPDWVTDKPEYTDALPCRWTSTRSGSRCAGYSWTDAAEDGCKAIKDPDPVTCYRLTSSSTPPVADLDSAVTDDNKYTCPAGWFKNVPCPTSEAPYLWCVTISGPLDATQVQGPTNVLTWSESVWARLHTSDRHAPPTPSGDPFNPPPPWQQETLPEVSEQMRGQWATTRSGHPGDDGLGCDAEVSFTDPEVIRRFMYTQCTYQITGSGTTPPAVPRYGVNSSGWNGDPAQVTPTAAKPYRWVVCRKRPTGGPDVDFGSWGTAEVDLVFMHTQYAYKLSTSGTAAPARPSGGPNSSDWSGTAVVPTGAKPYRWAVSRKRPTGPPGTPYGPWGDPYLDAEWQERSIWIAVTGGAPAKPTVAYASTPSWNGPGIGSGWYRFPAPHLITQEQDDALDFYSSSQSRVTPGSWSAWSTPSEFHPAVRPVRPPVP